MEDHTEWAHMQAGNEYHLQHLVNIITPHHFSSGFLGLPPHLMSHRLTVTSSLQGAGEGEEGGGAGTCMSEYIQLGGGKVNKTLREMSSF